MKLVEFWPASGKQSTFDLSALVPYPAGCDADVLQVLAVAPDGKIILMVENRGVTRFWSIEIESMKAVSLRTKPQLVLLNP